MSSALRSAVPFSLSTSHLTGLTRRLRSLPSLHVGAAALTVLVTGLLLAIATTSDPLWWQLHFSQLGIFGDVSSAFFNTTLKVSGVIVVVFAFCVRRDVRRLGRGPVRRGAATVAFICLNVVGVNLALVGCIPLNTDKDLHDRVAGSMVLGFLALLISAPIMFNRLGKRMAVSTVIATVWLVVSIALFVSATINLALFETISCTAMFAWSGMFTHVLAGAASRAVTPAHADSSRSGAHLAGRRARSRRLAGSLGVVSSTTAAASVSRTRSPRVSGPGRTARRMSVLALLAGRPASSLAARAEGRIDRASSMRSVGADRLRSAAASSARGPRAGATTTDPHSTRSLATATRANARDDAATASAPLEARGPAASAARPAIVAQAGGCRTAPRTHRRDERSEPRRGPARRQCFSRSSRRLSGCPSSAIGAAPVDGDDASSRAARRARRRSLAPSMRL